MAQAKKNISVIPATGTYDRHIRPQMKALRVAAYCRVSTLQEQQESSYEAQVSYYTEKIRGNPNWKLAGIYADDGKSATSTKKRSDFQAMIDDCMAGKIDMVLTKSISRFARNTVDALINSREGYSVRNLNYMKQFARRIPSAEILHQGGAKISWRAIKLLIDKTDNLEEHMWYTQQCLENGWSSTVLSHQIESGLYYRQALADKTTNFKEQLANPFSEQAEEIIKDPYIFDFIPNAKKLRETELEDALVQQITKLLLEFGSGFAFMGRQYPIQVGKREFFIDLLFYNVKLHCYFVVELKTVEFEPEFAGKLSFYLSAVDGELKSPNDNPTIGLLLCKGKDKMVAEYALKDVNKPMGVSEYKLSNHVSEELQDKLPSIEDIEKRLN